MRRGFMFDLLKWWNWREQARLASCTAIGIYNRKPGLAHGWPFIDEDWSRLSRHSADNPIHFNRSGL